MAEQLTEALADMPHLAPRDAAAVELATAYARAIDSDLADLSKAGPALLAVLESLLMTPRARAQATKKGGVQDGPRADKLDELRERRRARVDGTAAVDAVAP